MGRTIFHVAKEKLKQLREDRQLRSSSERGKRHLSRATKRVVDERTNKSRRRRR